jgi:hypothetical protein
MKNIIISVLSALGFLWSLGAAADSSTDQTLVGFMGKGNFGTLIVGGNLTSSAPNGVLGATSLGQTLSRIPETFVKGQPQFSTTTEYYCHQVIGNTSGSIGQITRTAPNTVGFAVGQWVMVYAQDNGGTNDIVRFKVIGTANSGPTLAVCDPAIAAAVTSSPPVAGFTGNGIKNVDGAAN